MAADPKANAIAGVHDNLWLWASDYLGTNPTNARKIIVIEAIRQLQGKADELEREIKASTETSHTQ